MVETITRLDEFKDSARSQDETLVSKAPAFTKEAGIIDWESTSSAKLYSLHRAIGHAIPLVTGFRHLRVQLRSVEPIPESILQILDSEFKDAVAGTIVYLDKNDLFCVKCLNSWIRVRVLRIEKRKDQQCRTFYKDYAVSSGIDQFFSLENNFQTSLINK